MGKHLNVGGFIAKHAVRSKSRARVDPKKFKPYNPTKIDSSVKFHGAQLERPQHGLSQEWALHNAHYQTGGGSFVRPKGHDAPGSGRYTSSSQAASGKGRTKKKK